MSDIYDEIGLGSPKRQTLSDIFDEALQRVGGVDFVVRVAEKNPVQFLALYVRSQPVKVEEKRDVRVVIDWASPDRLSYRHAQVPAAGGVQALPQPKTALVVPLHPPTRGENGGSG